tara:strand:+ start:29 stop:1273 length:1245 start_codon:yes stop_codon:yes gene_type:complete
MLQVTYKAIHTLIPYENNSRTHSEDQIQQIVDSIKEFGFTVPISIDENDGVIAGHGRIDAAKIVGMTEIPTIMLEGLSEAQRAAYVIADNKLALNAGWDVTRRNMEINRLNALNFNVGVLGFEVSELKSILQPEGLTDEDSVPEIPEEPVARRGDVWVLDNHRLMCGDSTSQDDLDTLMDGQLADMVFTDPPYNVNYGGGRKPGKHINFKRGGGIKAHGPIKNDDMTPEEFDEFLEKVFVNYYSHMKTLSPIYVCHPDSKTEAKITFEREFGKQFKKSATIIWDKGHSGLGYSDYRASHEPILYGWKQGTGSHFWCGDRTKKTVWSFSRGNTAEYVHPTQKPIHLVEEAISNSSKGQDIVLDLFGGSGSTLIACEKTVRYSRLMELDPKYCDVIVKRWQDYTGKEAILESNEEG